MTVSLTPAEAAAKVQQINDARDQAVQKLNQISDVQQQMLSSAWRGDSASRYDANAQGQREEFDTLISTLNSVVDRGSEHMNKLSNADQG